MVAKRGLKGSIYPFSPPPLEWVLKIGLMSSKIWIFYRISFFFLLGFMPPKKHTSERTYRGPIIGGIRPPVEGGTLFLRCLRWRAKVHFLLRCTYLCSDGVRTSCLIEFGWISSCVPKKQMVSSASCFGVVKVGYRKHVLLHGHVTSWGLPGGHFCCSAVREEARHVSCRTWRPDNSSVPPSFGNGLTGY